MACIFAFFTLFRWRLTYFLTGLALSKNWLKHKLFYFGSPATKLF